MILGKDICPICDKEKNLLHVYGYEICESCKSRLALIADKTIEKHVRSYQPKGNKKAASYPEEVERRLRSLQKDFIKTEIKLLHIQHRLKEMGDAE